MSSEANEIKDAILKEAADFYKKAKQRNVFEIVRSKSEAAKEARTPKCNQKTVTFAKNLTTDFEDVITPLQNDNNAQTD